jgi:hypothetical protein
MSWRDFIIMCAVGFVVLAGMALHNLATAIPVW